MNIEEIREYCLGIPGVTEGFPFDETTLVFKVMNKMFALTGLDGDPPFVNLKCDPERAIELRSQYKDIMAGWHMNKQQWNSVYFTGGIPASLIRELFDHSYELVVEGLKKTDREALESGDYL
ncbi:MAG: MmcQ/YjbR family DNA-binding protein [Bacteroidales bacterium]|nr:MmcQ/YjbR family DNA-binding protein [Bacteroidales bacterium]